MRRPVLLAGLSHVPLRVFLLADGIAALISVPFFIFLGHYFSDNIQVLMGYITGIKEHVVWVVGPLLVLLVIYWLVRRRRAGTSSSPETSDEAHRDDPADPQH